MCDKNLIKNDIISLNNNDKLKNMKDNGLQDAIVFNPLTKICDYHNTIIRKNPNLKELKIIIADDDGRQYPLYFLLSDAIEHTVADLVEQVSNLSKCNFYFFIYFDVIFKLVI